MRRSLAIAAATLLAVACSSKPGRPNQPPAAAPDAYAVASGTTLTVDAAAGVLANDADPDGDALVAAVEAGPAHGALQLAATGALVYVPVAGFSGQDRFTYRASDGALAAEPAAVTIDVLSPAIAALDPPSGTTGVRLAVAGVRFGTAVGSVTVGGRVAAVLSWSDTSVVATVPVDFEPGTHDVVVVTAGGVASAPSGYRVVPWIAAIAPGHGAPGDAVTVSGDGFGAAVGSATIGGVATTVEAWTNRAVTLRVPLDLAPGTHDVALLTAGGEPTNARKFTVTLDRWASDPAPSVRAGHTAVWTGTEMVVWGGHADWSVASTYPSAGGRYDPTTGGWRRTTTGGAAPAGRTEHTAVWTGTEMLVFGGFDGTWRSDGAAYDPAADAWRALASAGAPGARSRHSAVWTGTEMIVWGGWTGATGGPTATGGRYDPVADAWRPMSTVGAPSARRGHTAVWTGTEMIVWGGVDATGVRNDGARYDPATDSWRPLAATGAPSRRFAHTAVWTGAEMIVWGGFPLNEASPTSSGAIYDPAADAWRATASLNVPSARANHVAVWTGTEMVVWGGWVGGASSSISSGARFDPVANAWTSLATGNPLGRHHHAGVWTGEELIVWGGEGIDNFDPFFGDGGRWRRDAAGEAWTKIPGGTVPYQRTMHAAAWTGAELFVWGGEWNDASPYSYGYELAHGARYDPAAGTWTPVATTGQPARRASPSAVWTGSAVVVWGGISGSTWLGTGGRYDPATDAWAPTSLTGAPSGRRDHSAVWTGTEMIVWGGNGGAYLGDGAAYDPAADAWRRVTTGGAPTARLGHTAVWTGKEMIVWGGFDGTRLATGARYDPVADTWTSVSTVGAPSGRQFHSAVWTGTEMIVWGGYTNTSLAVADGAAYDPATDTWRPLATAGAPRARRSHTAVWTGTEMIVWGGLGRQSPNDVVLDTGARYDPAADAWTAMTALDAPSARTSHTAAWTGTEMLVWGGAPAGAEIARYRP